MAELGSRARDYVRSRGRSTIIFQGSIRRRTELQDLVMAAIIAASQTGQWQGNSRPRDCAVLMTSLVRPLTTTRDFSVCRLLGDS